MEIAIGFVLGLACLIGAFYFLRRKRLVDDTPTSKTLGVFIGLVELKGTAECESPLKSQLAEITCVQYDWRVEERWSRTVTETYTDSKGHRQTRTRRESGWTTVASGKKLAPFYLKDDTGIIRVLPEGAKIQGNQVFNRTVGRSDPLYYGKGPAMSVPNSDHRRRFMETAIPLHHSLYVIGQARERQDIVAAEIAHDKQASLFLISTRTEKQVSRGFGIKLWLFLILGFLCMMGGALVANLNAPVPAPDLFLIAFAGYVLLLFTGWAWMVYNSLVNLSLRVRQAHGQIDIQLKRRFDLIPNLAATVKDYAAHEQGLQTLLAQIRGQHTTESETHPEAIAAVLKVALENYPELKASGQFLRLQKELSETEQRIALARDYYNNIATFYNTRLQIIPDTLMARLMKRRPVDLILAADFERAPVPVKLTE